jgi:hypothetical protein
VVKSNHVGYGVMRESGVTHSVNGAGECGVEGLSDDMSGFWEWIEGSQFIGGCGLCAS